MLRKVVAVWITLIMIVSSVVILVEIAPIVQAPTTLYVGGAGGGNYSKIQWAIDNASDGDTVFVYNGTYFEDILVNKTINLFGEGVDNTIIDGSGNGKVVTITVDWINITGFTIQNGNRGVDITGNNITISNNVIRSINGVDGLDMGIGSKGGNAVGINIGPSSNILIMKNLIVNISGGDGGDTGNGGDPGADGGRGVGIYMHTSTKNIIDENFILNVCGGAGGQGGFNAIGGTGGPAMGIYFNVNNNNTIINNSIFSINGGTGGKEGNAGNAGGIGGIGNGIYLKNSNFNNILKNRINVSGGSGGKDKFGAGYKGFDQVGFGIYINEDSLDNNIPTNNTIDGDPIVYMYKEINKKIIHYNLTTRTNPTNFGKITLINCMDIIVKNNIIDNYKGITGSAGRNVHGYRDGNEGKIGVGVYLRFSTNVTLCNNSISNVTGGDGGSGVGSYSNRGTGSGGQAGFGMGIYFNSSHNNTIFKNKLYSIIGGKGGFGAGKGTFGRATGGCGGIGCGFFLSNSTENYYYNNSISSIDGGEGGKGSKLDGCSQVGFGFYIEKDSLKNLIMDNNLLNSDPIIYKYDKDNIEIRDFNLTTSANPTNFGKISLIYCNNSYVNNCSIANYEGISGITGKCYGMEPAGVGGNGSGIYLYSCNNTTVKNNIISSIRGGRGGTGGFADDGGKGGIGAGIHMLSSNNNTISDNIIKMIIGGKGGNGGEGYDVWKSGSEGENGVGAGIFLWNCSINKVIYNSLYSNTNSGIALSNFSNNNIIHHNNFLNNTNHVFFDNGTCYDNIWNDTKGEGNYWDDYYGSDNGSGGRVVGDGVGDTDIPHPFINQGNGYFQLDNYPLMNPVGNIIFLYNGWNLISIPNIQSEEKLTRVLGSIDSWYDSVQWYNTSSPSDPWKHHKLGKPFGNDLTHLNETMSFWIYITNPGNTIFLYNGTAPSSNQTIPLHPGWNMVGYPSLTKHNRTEGLNNLEFGPDVDCIQWYDAATKEWHFMGPDDHFSPGRGYWVHAKVEAGWEVPL